MNTPNSRFTIHDLRVLSLLRPFAASLLVLFVLTGCATLQQAERWGKVAQIAARRGTYETVKRHPELKDPFAAAAVSLEQLFVTDTINYEAVRATLQKLKINELRGEAGALIISDALDLYDLTFGDKIRIKDDSRLKPVVAGILTGIKDGLAMAEPGAKLRVPSSEFRVLIAWRSSGLSPP